MYSLKCCNNIFLSLFLLSILYFTASSFEEDLCILEENCIGCASENNCLYCYGECNHIDKMADDKIRWCNIQGFVRDVGKADTWFLNLMLCPKEDYCGIDDYVLDEEDDLHLEIPYSRSIVNGFCKYHFSNLNEYTISLSLTRKNYNDPGADVITIEKKKGSDVTRITNESFLTEKVTYTITDFDVIELYYKSILAAERGDVTLEISFDQDLSPDLNIVFIIFLILVVLIVLYAIFSCYRCVTKRRPNQISVQQNNDRGESEQQAINERVQEIMLELEEVKYTKDICRFDEPACCICFEDFELDNKVLKLKCLHVFHSNCIEEWIRARIQGPKCPCCNAQIKKEVGHEEEVEGNDESNSMNGLVGDESNVRVRISVREVNYGNRNSRNEGREENKSNRRSNNVVNGMNREIRNNVVIREYEEEKWNEEVMIENREGGNSRRNERITDRNILDSSSNPMLRVNSHAQRRQIGLSQYHH